MSSIRENILADVKAALEDIQTSNGYYYDVKGVYRWRTPAANLLSYPSLIIADVGETVEQLNYPIHQRNLALLIQGILRIEYTDDDDVGLASTRLITDIEKALMEQYNRNCNAVDTVLQSNQTFLGTPDSPFLTVEVVAEIRYRTLLTDPETAK